MVLTFLTSLSLSGFGPLFSQCPKTQLRKPWVTIAWWLSPHLSWSGWNGCFWPHSGVSWHQCGSTAACIQEEPVCHPLCSHACVSLLFLNSDSVFNTIIPQTLTNKLLLCVTGCWTSWQAGHPPPSNLKPALHKGVYGGLYCVHFSRDYSAKYPGNHILKFVDGCCWSDLWSLHTGKRWKSNLTWATNSASIMKEADQWLFFMRRLK